MIQRLKEENKDAGVFIPPVPSLFGHHRLAESLHCRSRRCRGDPSIQPSLPWSSYHPLTLSGQGMIKKKNLSAVNSKVPQHPL